MEPGREGGFAAERVDFAEKLEEGFLREVLGFERVSEHAEAETVDAARVLAIESFERGGVTALSAEDCGIELGGWRRSLWKRLGVTRLRIGKSFHWVSMGASFLNSIPIGWRGGDGGLSLKRHNGVKLSARSKNDGFTGRVLRFDVPMDESVSGEGGGS